MLILKIAESISNLKSLTAKDVKFICIEIKILKDAFKTIIKIIEKQYGKQWIIRIMTDEMDNQIFKLKYVKHDFLHLIVFFLIFFIKTIFKCIKK